MERTLQDTGVNGVKELSFFYTNRVLRYNHRLRRQGEHLHNECLKATHEWSRSRKKEASSSKMMMQWDDSEGGESSGNEVNDGDHSYKKYKNFINANYLFFFCFFNTFLFVLEFCRPLKVQQIWKKLISYIWKIMPLSWVIFKK